MDTSSSSRPPLYEIKWTCLYSKADLVASMSYAFLLIVITLGSATYGHEAKLFQNEAVCIIISTSGSVIVLIAWILVYTLLGETYTAPSICVGKNLAYIKKVSNFHPFIVVHSGIGCGLSSYHGMGCGLSSYHGMGCGFRRTRSLPGWQHHSFLWWPTDCQKAAEPLWWHLATESNLDPPPPNQCTEMYDIVDFHHPFNTKRFSVVGRTLA